MDCVIGDTPLIRVEQGLYAKFECYNPSGSIKDRVIWHILTKAKRENRLSEGQRLVEASSGNSGIAVAMIGSFLGHPVTIILPSNMSDERKQMIRLFGADLVEVGPGDFVGAIQMRNELVQQNGWFNVNQFHSSDNIECHWLTTGAEIVEQMKVVGPVHAFVSGTGTGGTIMGVRKRLESEYSTCPTIIAVEPAENPSMSTGCNNGQLHGIQGIGDGAKFLVDLKMVDQFEQVSTDDARIECHSLIRKGLFVGLSSAANVIAARRYLVKNPGHNVVTILPDRAERYLSVLGVSAARH